MSTSRTRESSRDHALARVSEPSIRVVSREDGVMTDDKKAPAAGSAQIRRAKERSGVVKAAGTKTTVTVEVTRRVQHAQYGKYQTRRKTYAAHDLLGCKVGDQVLIRETRPLSKTKRWRVVEKIASAGGSES